MNAKLKLTCLLFLLLFCFINLVEAQQESAKILSSDSLRNKTVSRIAFGSCGHQDKKQPVLTKVVENKPDMFIYLGDNIYADTKDMNVLQKKYDKLAQKKEFQSLRSNTVVLSVWDDHDYGWNDAGKEYPKKEESKQIFMDFWKVPKDSPRRKRKGIYGSHIFKNNGRSVQVLLLDTRTFRDPLKHRDRSITGKGYKNDYQPDPNPKKTLLGLEQWEWLEKELKKPADLRVVASSIQFGHQYNGWESWTNLPAEQQKFVDLIRKTKAGGVVFISGDVHWAEISKRTFENQYPLYDVTASGITQEWPNFEPNKYRIGKVYRWNHFGMIEVDWSKKDPSVTLKHVDVNGKLQNSYSFPLSEIQF